MFNKKHFTSGFENSSSLDIGATDMTINSNSLKNRIKMTAAVAVIVIGAVVSSAGPASAASVDPVPGFTPDGVNFIAAAGFDSPADQVVSYLNDWNHSPDGVGNIQDRSPEAPAIAMFTPDGVNQIASVGGPIVARRQVPAYMSGGNFSPDGVGDIHTVTSTVVDMNNLAYLYAETDAAYVG